MITPLQIPSLALAQDEPGESTGSSDPEPDGDPADSAGDDEEPASGRSGEIQEVIQVEGVRASGLKEVPISVTSFGASDIQSLRIQNVADLSAYTPNLEINTSFAASNPTLFIRGVGLKDYNSNSTGAVSIWQDGIQMNSPAAQLFSLYDIENIAVLSGPIGGVGGRNASAGSIRIESFKPNGEWTSDGSFTYGNLNLLQFEGALGFPIFPDFLNETLSARIAVTTEFRDGYTNNTCSNWNPEQYGYLESSEQNTREWYDLLEPFEDPNTNGNRRWQYLNIEAVDEYNAYPQDQRINTTVINGREVGLQRRSFSIAPDLTCLLRNPGRVVTGRGASAREPEGTFVPDLNVLVLSDFQGLQKTYNDIEYYAGRGQLLFEPAERWSFLANFHWGANRGDAFHVQPVGARSKGVAQDELAEPITRSVGHFQNANRPGFSELGGFTQTGDDPAPAPFESPVARKGFTQRNGLGEGYAGSDVFNGFYSNDGKEKLDLMGASLNASYEPDWGRIVYVGGWEFNSRDIVDEGGGCPCTDLLAILDDQTWQFSNDLRVMGGGYGFDWIFAFFQLHERLDSQNLYPSSIRFGFDQTYQQITDAYNVATDLHYDFLEDGAFRWLYQLSFDGGFRYNWEKKQFSLGSDVLKNRLRTDAEPVVISAIPEETRTGTWKGPAGEATLSFLPVENARVYAKYTRGLKAGHFNAGLTIQADDSVAQNLSPVAPESVNALEVGLKSSWAEDRVELNAAFFRYWYTDMQVFDIVNDEGAIPTQQLLNADADVIGAEISLTARPVDGWTVNLSGGWLNSSFGEFLVTKTAILGNQTGGNSGEVAVFNYEDNPLIAAPRWSFSGYTDYELPLYRWGSVVPSFEFSFKSRTYLDAQKEIMISQEPYWLFGARLAYRTPGGAVEVAGWVKNFMDRRYKIDSFDLTRQFNQINEVWAEPRTFGITLSYGF